MRESASIEVNESAGEACESAITSMMIAKEVLAQPGVRGHFEVEVLTAALTLPLEKFWEFVMTPLLRQQQNVDKAYESTDESTAVMNRQFAKVKVVIKTTTEGKARITIDLADMPCCNGGPQWGHACGFKTLP